MLQADRIVLLDHVDGKREDRCEAVTLHGPETWSRNESVPLFPRTASQYFRPASTVNGVTVTAFHAPAIGEEFEPLVRRVPGRPALSAYSATRTVAERLALSR